MRCLIVDDDAFSRKVVRKCVERSGQLQLIGECSSAEEALTVVSKEEVELLFLDVEMPGMDGLEFIQALVSVPLVVLITSKEEYAVEAFAHDVIDYIVKPVDFGRFARAVEKATLAQQSVQVPANNPNHIFIKKDNRQVRVGLEEIHYIEALADYVNIYTDHTRFTVLSTMKAMQSKLPLEDFARTHRSFIVRLDRIQAIEENALVIENKSIPISRSFKESLMQKLNLL